MKIQSFKTVTDFPQVKTWEKRRLSSVVIEEILKITYPSHTKLLPLQRKKLYLYVFDYLFDAVEEIFSEIEAMTNVVFAYNLKGYQFLVEKNRLKSFAELDDYMQLKKNKSFDVLNHSLSQHEILDENEKTKIIGGRKWNRFFANILSISFQLKTA